MVQLFCKLCLKSIPYPIWRIHITQKEHLQQLPLRIVVKGTFPRDKINEFYAYFGKFGGIRSQNVIADGIEYRFWDARVYSEVIHNEHIFGGLELEISWYKRGKNGVVEHVAQGETMRNEKFVYRKLTLISATKDIPFFPEQLSVFLSNITPFQNQRQQTREAIHSDLLTSLSPNFPQSNLQFFGSTIVNLDLQDSDLNIYIDQADAELKTLEMLKNSVLSSGNFISAVVVSDVVKCEHKSRVECELSTKNELPVGTSELLKFYLSLNDKLRVLMLVVKFWADCHELRKQSGFCSYAINLMVLFYLQHEPYRLPSVWELQKDNPCDEVNGWNCAFGPVEFSNTPLENATVLDLLKGFFHFYSNFDYTSQVVCIYTGRPLNKSIFIEPRELPQWYYNKEKVFQIGTGMCIQDPFEHDKNVSILVPLGCSGRLAATCRHAGQMTSFFNLMLLSPSNTFFINIIEQGNKDWRLILKRLMVKILTDICACEVKNTAVTTYLCKGSHNVWNNRPEAGKRVARGSNSLVEYESEVTSLLVKSSAILMNWEVEVVLIFDPDRVRVEFNQKSAFSLLQHVQHYVYLTLLKCLSDKSSVAMMREDEPSVCVMEAEEIFPEDIKHEIETQSWDTSDSVQVGCSVEEKLDVTEEQSSFFSHVKTEDESSPNDPLKTILNLNESVQNMRRYVGIDCDNSGDDGVGSTQLDSTWSESIAGTSRVATPDTSDTTWSDIPTTTSLGRLPQKSRKQYALAYNQFKEWCARTNNQDNLTESVLLEYFSEKALQSKSSTIWAHYSMVKACLAVDNVDISSFRKLTSFLKENSIGYRPKTSKFFTRTDIERFLIGAPDKTYLLMKVILIMGIAGGCRCDELAKMKIDDIEDTGSVLIVRIPQSPTGGDCERTFTIVGRTGLNMLEIYRKYASLRKSHTEHRRFFVNYQQGKCSVQPVGVHTFGRTPGLIAKYLQLEHPSSYTGHSFRKSNTVLRADAGVDILSGVAKRRRPL